MLRGSCSRKRAEHPLGRAFPRYWPWARAWERFHGGACRAANPLQDRDPTGFLCHPRMGSTESAPHLPAWPTTANGESAQVGVHPPSMAPGSSQGPRAPTAIAARVPPPPHAPTSRRAPAPLGGKPCTEARTATRAVPEITAQSGASRTSPRSSAPTTLGHRPLARATLSALNPCTGTRGCWCGCHRRGLARGGKTRTGRKYN